MKFYSTSLLFGYVAAQAEVDNPNPDGTCYWDNGNRDMPAGPYDLPNYTAKSNVVWCRDKCYREGYLYAGVQAGNQCFCGDTFGKYGLAILEGEIWCQQECKSLSNRDGDANEICGGSWANNIYNAEEAPVTYTHYGEGHGFFKQNSRSLIDGMDLAALASHGCWCGRLTGESELEGSETIDAVDELCKEWFMKRRCLQVYGGACSMEGSLSENGYFVANGRLESYDDVCEDEVESCAGSTCRVDEDMRRKLNGTIFDLLEAGGQFPRQTNNCGVAGNPHPSPQCVGVAPDVEMLLQNMQTLEDGDVSDMNQIGEIEMYENYTVSFEILMTELKSVARGSPNLVSVGADRHTRLPAIHLNERSATRIQVCGACGRGQRYTYFDLPAVTNEWIPIVYSVQRYDDDWLDATVTVGEEIKTLQVPNCWVHGRLDNYAGVDNIPLGSQPVWFSGGPGYENAGSMDWVKYKDFKIVEHE